MTNDSKNTLESNEFIENINYSLTAEEIIRLKNVKSKVNKAISCSKLLLEICRENVKQIANAKNNETIVELVNNNKNINETDLIVRNYILDEMQIIADKTGEKGKRIGELERIIKNLQSELNEENKTEIVDELNIYITEFNNIKLAFRKDVDLINEYKRYCTFINTRE
jgi:hypothetical protein